jgi:hypothetical protein
MSLEGFLMICPFCYQEMDDFDYCEKDRLMYWPVKYVARTSGPGMADFKERHPGQAAYYYYPHSKYYTVPEMERLVKLKAFL